MTRATRDALQALCTQLTSLAVGLKDTVDHPSLVRLVEASEKTFQALNDEALDPEFVPIIEKKPAP